MLSEHPNRRGEGDSQKLSMEKKSPGISDVIHCLLVFWIRHLLARHRLCITLLHFLDLLLISVLSLTAGIDCDCLHLHSYFVVIFCVSVFFFFLFFHYCVHPSIENCGWKWKIIVTNYRASLLVLTCYPLHQTMQTVTHSRQGSPAQLPHEQSWGPQRGAASHGTEWCRHVKPSRVAWKLESINISTHAKKYECENTMHLCLLFNVGE